MTVVNYLLLLDTFPLFRKRASQAPQEGEGTPTKRRSQCTPRFPQIEYREGVSLEPAPFAIGERQVSLSGLEHAESPMEPDDAIDTRSLGSSGADPRLTSAREESGVRAESVETSASSDEVNVNAAPERLLSRLGEFPHLKMRMAVLRKYQLGEFPTPPST